MDLPIADIDNLAQVACSGGSEGTEAEMQFRSQYGDNIDALIAIMQMSQNQYTLMVVSQSVIVWFKNTVKTSQMSLLSEVLNAMLEAARPILTNPEVPRFIVDTIQHSLAKCVKLTYSEDVGCTVLLQDAIATLNAPSITDNRPMTQYAFSVLTTLVKVFNLYDGSKSSTFMNFAVHRRCSNNFRDAHLLDIFQLSTNHLASVMDNSSPFAYEIVALVKEILTYDFMAIMVDETEEALSTQFPSSWKETLFNMDLLEMLWGQAKSLQGDLALMMLTAMGGICGTRRSFFDNVDEKLNFLNFSLSEIAQIPSVQCSDDRMNDAEYRAVFADCILKFVPPFGYKDLSTSSSFKVWLETVASFTQMLFNIPFGEEGSFNTTQTLMSFWTRMTNSKRMYLCDEDTKPDLEFYVPTIAVEYFKSRTSPQNFAFSDEVTDAILQQCEQFPTLLLLNTRESVGMITDNIRAVGEEVLTSHCALAWLFYLTGSCIRTLLANMTEETIECTGLFIGVVTELAITRERFGSSEAVELAALHFFNSVHSVFVTSRMTSYASKIIEHVFENKTKLFQVVIENVGANMLRDATQSPELVRASIDLIGEACRDAPPSLLRELNFDLPPVVELTLSQRRETYKLRTPLLATLWAIRLPDPFTLENFNNFMAPIEELMNATIEGGQRDPLFIAGWLRDLRGVSLASCQSQQAFADFVDWVIDRSEAFTFIAQMQQAPNVVVISLMRFISELVTASRHGRVNLPTSNHSAAGVVLFKFVASIIQDVLQNVITDDEIARAQSGVMTDGAYQYMMKPLMICMQALRKCVSGDFVPFGAMVLYNDNTFDMTVVGIMRFLKVFPHDLFSQYPKVIFAAMQMLQSLIECQVYSPLIELEPDELRAMIDLTIAVVTNTETATSTLLYGLSFAAFIAGMRSLTLKLASGQPVAQARHTSASRTSRRIKEQIALKLMSQDDVWGELIMAAMTIMTTQDRALSPCCSVVWPIFDSDPPMWQRFTEVFTMSYPPHKRDAVMATLQNLASAAQSEQKFFSEIFHFRAAIRML